jgi:hypothetical protein
MEQIERVFYVTGCLILDNLVPVEYLVSAIGTKVNESIRLRNEQRIQRNKMDTIIEVKCPTCNAESFTPCVYVPSVPNTKSGLTGKTLIRSGKPWYHDKRKYLQTHVELEYIYNPEALDRLKLWIMDHGNILGGDLMNSI